MKPDRVVSVDILRGLAIATMVFVNDLGPAAPSWLKHIQPHDTDGMTIPDVIFPMFLFISGMSIPLALDRTLRSGVSRWKVFGHSLRRTCILVLLGLIEVNYANDIRYDSRIWGLLAYVSGILACCTFLPHSISQKTIFTVVKVLGLLAFFGLFISYSREPIETEFLFFQVEHWTWLQTSWWGILGLLGWSYLAVSITYILLGNRRELIMGMLGLLLLLNYSSYQGDIFANFPRKNWLGILLPIFDTTSSYYDAINGYLYVPTVFGTMASATMAGCLLGSVLSEEVYSSMSKNSTTYAIMFAGGLFSAALLSDCFGGINKIAATAAWSLLSAAITCLLWSLIQAAIYFLDLGGKLAFLEFLGRNALLVYLLHPIVLWTSELLVISDAVFSYKNSINANTLVLGSFTCTLFVCALTKLIVRAGLRMKI